MVQQFELFQVSLLISVRIMFLSNAFSMPEMVFHRILREWWTDDEDGECISFD